MKPEVRRFVEEMLTVIRRQFFAGHDDKQFWQERNMLMQAVLYPAAWLNDKGVEQPASIYRQIIHKVIATIKRHGTRDIQRVSAYFLHSVQEHMKHHGDEYYEAAKAARSVGSIVPVALRRMQPRSGPDRTTAIMAEAHKMLRSPGGRHKKKAPVQPELFGSAQSVQKP